MGKALQRLTPDNGKTDLRNLTQKGRFGHSGRACLSFRTPVGTGNMTPHGEWAAGEADFRHLRMRQAAERRGNYGENEESEKASGRMAFVPAVPAVHPVYPVDAYDTGHPMVFF